MITTPLRDVTRIAPTLVTKGEVPTANGSVKGRAIADISNALGGNPYAAKPR
jgi:hypothetical protein